MIGKNEKLNTPGSAKVQCKWRVPLLPARWNQAAAALQLVHACVPRRTRPFAVAAQQFRGGGLA